MNVNKCEIKCNMVKFSEKFRYNYSFKEGYFLYFIHFTRIKIMYLYEIITQFLSLIKDFLKELFLLFFLFRNIITIKILHIYIYIFIIFVCCAIFLK